MPSGQYRSVNGKSASCFPERPPAHNRPARGTSSTLSLPSPTLSDAASPHTQPRRMPSTNVRVVDVYPYRYESVNPEFLLLRRAPGTEYAGQWRMVGGKIRADEAAWETGLREVEEETRQAPTQFWALPSVNAFYEWQADRVNLAPAFAAELPGAPTLDDEHDDYAWYPAQEAVQHLRWPEQQRLLRLADRVLRDGIPPSLIIDV